MPTYRVQVNALITVGADNEEEAIEAAIKEVSSEDCEVEVVK